MSIAKLEAHGRGLFGGCGCPWAVYPGPVGAVQPITFCLHFGARLRAKARRLRRAEGAGDGKQAGERTPGQQRPGADNPGPPKAEARREAANGGQPGGSRDRRQGRAGADQGGGARRRAAGAGRPEHRAARAQGPTARAPGRAAGPQWRKKDGPRKGDGQRRIPWRVWAPRRALRPGAQRGEERGAERRQPRTRGRRWPPRRTPASAAPQPLGTGLR